MLQEQNAPLDYTPSKGSRLLRIVDEDTMSYGCFSSKDVGEVRSNFCLFRDCKYAFFGVFARFQAQSDVIVKLRLL